jgi:phosphoglycerate dehydrogenase-like enzyme
MTDNEQINVVVTVDFSEAIMTRLREISPRLNVKKYTSAVPDNVWSTAEVLYTSRIFPAPEDAPMLRWIQLNSAGLERAMQHPVVKTDAVQVTSASGIHAQQIANYCLMMMLAFNYKLPTMMRYQQRAEWPDDKFSIFKPVDMNKQTLGLVGYGSIARELARLAQTLGMRVLATKRDIKKTAETRTDYAQTGTGDSDGSIPERIYPSETLPSMVGECDYLMVNVPLTDQTRHMVDEAVLNAMKPSAVLINIARGAVVDEQALIHALQTGTIGGAGLDVFEKEPLPADSPLWHMDNVIISPHVSGNSDDYLDKAADLFAENLKRYLDNKPLYNQLDRDEGY